VKVENKQKTILYSWLLIGTYHKNLAISIFLVENLANVGHFLP